MDGKSANSCDEEYGGERAKNCLEFGLFGIGEVYWTAKD